MEDTTYNGWTNYETWNLNLWIDNDEGHYKGKVRFLRSKAQELNVETVTNFCMRRFPKGTPDMNGPADMTKVNYEEILEHWQHERVEIRQYREGLKR